MREFKKLPLELFIGYDIEQNSRVIELDASEMVEKYPSGILQLVCKRPGEETTYIAPSFEQDGGTLRWTLTSYDVEKAGQGLAIVALVDTSEESVKVLASHKIRTGIEEGLHFRDAERVDPEDSLIARVLAAVSQAQAYAQDAKEEADRAEAALGDVDDAKDQAISAIETKGAETLDSIPSNYTALSGDVSDLKSAFEAVADVKYNYFNPSDAVTGYYYDGMTIGNVISKNANANYCGIIFPVTKGHTYVLQRTDWRWEELDEDNKVLAYHGTAVKATGLSITPNTNGVKKVAISWTKGTVAISEYMILDTGVSFSEYIPYPYISKITEKTIEDTGIVTKEEIDTDKTEKVISGFSLKYNYFNPENALSGKFYDGNVGDTISSHDNSGYACCIIPVTAGKTYVLSRTDYRWNELDENNVILERHGSAVVQTQLQVTPNAVGVKKIAFSWNKGNVPIALYMVLDTGVSFSKYIPYPYSLAIEQDILEASGVTAPAIYTVGQNGDFSTFTSALVALANDTSPKTIYVQTGVYDIFEELGGKAYMESIDVSAGWRVANKLVPQNTTIIGIGDVVLNFNPADDEIVDYSHAWLMSALNISGSCTIENITINASNCRFAVHIESTDALDDANTAEIVFRNVRATRTATTIMGDHQTIGSGIGYNARWTFDSCVFKGTGGSHCFSVHTNAPSVNASASVIFNNCIFDTISGNTVSTKLINFISHYLPVAITNNAYVNNCFVRGKIGTETTLTNRQSFNVNVNGGTSYGIADSSTQTSGYTINNYGNNIIS